MKPVSIALVVLCVAVLSAGLIWPPFAGTFLRAFLAIAAVALVTRWTIRAPLPRRVATDTYSPFDSDATPPTPSSSLAGIQKLSALLKPVESAEDSQRAPIPETARRVLTTQARNRLAENHGLELESPDDHERIKTLLSEATWSLVRPRPRRGPSSAIANPVPQLLLGAILDDLEQL